MTTDRQPANPMTMVLIAWLAALSLAIGWAWFALAAVDQTAGTTTASRAEFLAAKPAAR